ncbi:hypothetical protein ACP275_10G140400 [Erythranthe tilingii]
MPHSIYTRMISFSFYAAVDLLKQEQVHGIIRPQTSTEETFFAELGQKSHVPIISFNARTSSLPSAYSVRTTPDDSVQARALAAIFRAFEWPEIAVLYEETSSGNQFISHLNKAFQEVDIGLACMVPIQTSAEDTDISKELNKLSRKQTRVFLVHTNPSLGFRLFTLTKSAGVMSEEYAWIITNSLSIFLNSIDSAVRDSMEGVVGVRPYVLNSKALESFKERLRRNMTMSNTTTTSPITELNVYGLWAYDAVTALAIALEKIVPFNSTSLGPRLLNELLTTKFRGLTGDFELFNGKMKPLAFEIFNMIGTGEKTVGFWTPERGITRDLTSSTGEKTYATSAKELKTITWPGDSVTRPKGWAIPTTGNLRVGVPWKHGFTEFANCFLFPPSINLFITTTRTNIDWSYDDMLRGIPEDYDMVVGDVTVWAPRAAHVDFSLPYSESGVILVVKNKKPFDMWIFMKPLKWNLWLAIVVACVLMGVVLHILENRVTSNDAGSIIENKERRRAIYWSPVTVLAFPERNMVSNNWSFFVLVLWLFMAFILMQSYTANLSAILTVDQLKFSFSDSYYVGCQEGSFMKEFLINQLHISPSRLRSYNSSEEYHKAMSKGSENGGIDAIFDEIPYMKLFLNKYDSQYKMAGPTYRTGGFGFAFPVGSPLVAHFSKAILDVTQGPNMTAIEQKNFGPGYSSQDPLSSRISQQRSSLTLYDFAGLFFIIGSVTLFSLFCSETAIGRKLTDKTANFIHILFHFKSSRVMSMEVDGDTNEPVANDDDDVSDVSVRDGTDTTTRVIEAGPENGEIIDNVTDNNQQ